MKRILSALLVLCLLAGMVPMAGAADSPVIRRLSSGAALGRLLICFARSSRGKIAKFLCRKKHVNYT